MLYIRDNFQFENVRFYIFFIANCEGIIKLSGVSMQQLQGTWLEMVEGF